jgi:hypothetical protein
MWNTYGMSIGQTLSQLHPKIANKVRFKIESVMLKKLLPFQTDVFYLLVYTGLFVLCQKPGNCSLRKNVFISKLQLFVIQLWNKLQTSKLTFPISRIHSWLCWYVGFTCRFINDHWAVIDDETVINWGQLVGIWRWQFERHLG